MAYALAARGLLKPSNQRIWCGGPTLRTVVLIVVILFYSSVVWRLELILRLVKILSLLSISQEIGLSEELLPILRNLGVLCKLIQSLLFKSLLVFEFLLNQVLLYPLGIQILLDVFPVHVVVEAPDADGEHDQTKAK